MSSVAARTRQNAPSHFMNISSLSGLIYAYNPTAGVSTFSTASWASVGTNNPYLSTIATAGGLLKDLGKNVISSNRYFRKIQLVLPNGGPRPSTGASTFGVAGAVGTNPNVDYLTGYIELGYEGGGVPAPVVQFGTL
jgi:hypothetical protein